MCDNSHFTDRVPLRLHAQVYAILRLGARSLTSVDVADLEHEHTKNDRQPPHHGRLARKWGNRLDRNVCRAPATINSLVIDVRSPIRAWRTYESLYSGESWTRCYR